jgi:SAM-dependent methyltransferase
MTLPRVPYEACPLCEARAPAVLLEADCTRHPLYHPTVPSLVRWMRCAGCAHVFTDGYFSAEAAAIIFGGVLEHQRPGADMENQRTISARMVDRVARHGGAGDWLDVGFGNGSLLFTAAEWGFRPVGLDLRPETARAMRGFGVEVHEIDIAQLDAPSRFGVVSMADVLEHIPFPRRALAAAHRLLREGGLLFVSMPNMGCPVWSALDAAGINPYWGELEHFHNFSRERLYALLAQHGFEPLQYDVSQRYRVGMEVIARRLPLPA